MRYESFSRLQLSIENDQVISRLLLNKLNEDNDWIRIECEAGDSIMLPAGMYHRFQPDENKSFKVQRSCGQKTEHVAHGRLDKVHPDCNVRMEYESKFLKDLKG